MRKISELLFALSLIFLGLGGPSMAGGDNPSAGAAPSPLALIGPSCVTNASAGSSTASLATVAGAVSATAMVVVSDNDRLNVYNRSTCAQTSSQSLTAFFKSTGIGANVQVLLPKLIYDRRSARFFLTALGIDMVNHDTYQLYAVSTNGAAAGWFKYRIGINVGGGSYCGSTGGWFSVSIGVQDKRWLISGEYSGASGARGALLVIDKTPTLTGAAQAYTCFGDYGTLFEAPIVYDSNTRATMVGYPVGGSATAIKRYDLEVSATTVLADAFLARPDYSVASRSFPSALAQPGGQKLFPVGGAPTVQIGGSLWMVESVLVGGFSRWRMYRFSNAATTSSTVLTTFTSPSTVVGNNDHLFNPSIAVTGASAGMPIFVTALRLIPSLTTGYQGNATMMVFEGPNNSNIATNWLYSVAAQTQYRFSLDGTGNSCNASSSGACALGYNPTTTQADEGAGAQNRAWSWAPLPAGASQLQWKSRAVRSEYGPF